MKLPFRATFQQKRGYSLVELLVVIAVIGLITLIAVPMVSNILGKSDNATTRRNAQLVAAMAGQALHAGNTSLTEASSKEDAVALLAAGVTGGDSLASVKFRLPLTAEEQSHILPHLLYVDGLLVINPQEP